MSKEKKNVISRAIRYLRVNLAQYRRGVKAKDVDIVMGSSTPPIQGIMCAKIAKKLSKKYGKKVPFIFTLQDVFPDSLVTTGIAKKGSLVYKIGNKISNYIYKHADKIIVISEDIKNNIMAKGVPEEKIEIIYNWIDTDAVRPVCAQDNKLYNELGLNKETFKIVYAGNLGKAQGVDTLLSAAERLNDVSDIEFLIFGRGAEEENLKKRAIGLSNVKFFPLLPMERVPEVYSLGDACAILCRKGTGGSGVPSKTWSIMACNTPIIASFDTDSELAEIIEKAEAGVCVAPEAPEAIANAILKIKSQKGSFACKGREFAIKNASKTLCTQKYVDVLLGVCEINSIRK